MYCENYKIGSTTWVDHLVKLANKTKNAEHSHKQVEILYPQLKGLIRDEFEKVAFKFFIVRDPFERILSAYLDKMTEIYPRNSTHWATFGKIQACYL
ncbi:carbohydrate sulfotransferase 10 [Eurytemora carolleeae]|uniref:carbohydrate sulfotransferase 10 n=1 Tax=Eurytemora carolleeae TaxID=1294199 RepID=UPI000C76033A|nr:carbohydrate sulfotransferase 10 [Eurytemora carolleeae]|eukprot:XP_023331005.1 carbohydrate sulfotransferase 10-like [Eurytemora affinis]